MRRIAIKHLEETERELSHPFDIGHITMTLGLISFVLYTLLYHFNLDIRHLAELANHGSKTWFWVPIVIALIFSLVHGAFTGHFWESLGLKAKS